MLPGKKNKIVGFLVALFLWTGSAIAQEYRAAVQKIDSPGFYKISLQPTFVAKSEANLRDLRIQNAKGQAIPYVNSSDVPVKPEQQFVTFPVIEKAAKTDSETTLVIENKATQPLRRLWLKLKNTDVSFTINILGSDDLHNWFAITDERSPGQPEPGDNGQSQIDFDFPASNYRYFKISAKQRQKTPINLLSAGIYTSPSLESAYLPILPVKVTQRDSDKTSWVYIALNDHYEINKIHLDLSGPKYFKRVVRVYADAGRLSDLISETELNSSTMSDLYLSTKTSRILLQIDNGDNIPLKIVAAQVYQADEYIISYLEKGQYYLLTGNPSAEEPSYDLKSFADSMHYIIPHITHLAVTRNPAFHSAPPPNNKLNTTSIIWIAIVAALLLLSLLTWKMLTEVNNKSSGN
jgi:hypothetical protein